MVRPRLEQGLPAVSLGFARGLASRTNRTKEREKDQQVSRGADTVSVEVFLCGEPSEGAQELQQIRGAMGEVVVKIGRAPMRFPDVVSGVDVQVGVDRGLA